MLRIKLPFIAVIYVFLNNLPAVVCVFTNNFLNNYYENVSGDTDIGNRTHTVAKQKGLQTNLNIRL